MIPIHSDVCQALIITCIDFRFQGYIQEWIDTTISGGFDRVAIAGGVKNLPFILEQVEISRRLHHISRIYLMNHEDCGAYGKTASFDAHKDDLLSARSAIISQFPQLEVISFYMKLTGEMVHI